MDVFNRLFCCFIFWVSVANLSAQSDHLFTSSQALFFLANKSNEFVVLDDSSFYYTKKPDGEKWQKHAYTFLGDNISFDYFLNRFSPISTSDGRLFFVYTGVGEVYQLANDTLRRIDNSFKHENQFMHSLFEYNNRIYAFGGYGLFTFKNIITYFDTNTKEWFEVITPIKPAPRASQHFQRIGDDVYIFAGGYSNGDVVKNYRDCWKFNLKSHTWKRIGEIEKVFFDTHLRAGSVYPHLPTVYTFHSSNVHEIDIKANKLRAYQTVSFPNVHYAVRDAQRKIVLLVKHHKHQLEFFTVDLQSLLELKTKEIPFTTEKSFIQLWMLYLLVFLIIASVSVGLWLRKKSNTSKASPVKNKLVLDELTSHILIGNKNINSELSLLEYRILKKFILQRGEPIDIIALNEFFEDDSSSHTAQKKRRETTLKALREKLSFLLQVPIDSVFLESRDLKDKRVKLFVINPAILA